VGHAAARAANLAVEDGRGLPRGLPRRHRRAVLASLYQDWLSASEALALGAAVSIAAPLGDLFESLIKRDVGTKDTGGLFGVHGGALDRLDAALFSLIAGYQVWQALT